MPLKRPLLSLSAFYFLLSAFTPLAPAQTIDPILARRRTLDNISITFRKTVEHTPDMEMLIKLIGPKEAGKIFHGTYVFNNEFACLADRVRYKQAAVSEPHQWLDFIFKPPVIPTLSTQSVFTPERILGFKQTPNRTMGMIYPPNAFPLQNDSLIEVALGMRAWNEPRLLSAEDLKLLTTTRENNQLVLSHTGKQNMTHRWFYGPGPEAPLISYTVTSAQGNLLWQFTNKNLTTIAGISMPQTIVAQRITYGAEKSRIIQAETLQLTKILINDPANTPESFDITWPVGSSVTDQRSGKKILIKSNAKTLSDTDIANLPTPPQRPQRPAPPPSN